MSHLSEFDLALYAGGELSLGRRLRFRLHLRGCEPCRRQQAAYTEARRELLEGAGELPVGLDWERISSEMTANIRLGLAAGECVAKRSTPRQLAGWRPATVLAGSLLFVLCAWLLTQQVQAPPPPVVANGPAALASGATLEVTAAGVGFRDRDRGLTLRNPDQNVAYTVNLEGSVRARYVDSETGQVTINHVYVE